MTDAEHYTPHEMWQRRNNQQPVKRVASVAIGTLFQSEFIRTYVRTRLYVNKNFPEYTYLGAGYEQRAYRRGKEVLKILIMEFPGLSLEDTAEKLQCYSDTCRREIHKIWTPTQFEVAKLPVTGGSAVVARQPYRESRVSYYDMYELARDKSVSSREKRQFAHELEGLHELTGLYADIRGNHNVLYGAGGFIIVDTILIDGQRQDFRVSDNLTAAEDVQSKLEIIKAA